MEFPSIIKGVWNSYEIGEKKEAIIPIGDISKFSLSHLVDKNGLQIRGHIKSELIEQYNYSYTQIIKEGKYNIHQKTFSIRAKDMPKFRKELFKELMKTPTITITTGINAGTPAAQSYTFSKKELGVN
jgi:hypothetical protein